MGSCNSTEDGQSHPIRKAAALSPVPVTSQNKEQAKAFAEKAREAYLNPKDPCSGWDPVETQQNAVKLDPDNVQYRLGLLKLLGQGRGGNGDSVSKIEHAYKAARARRLLEDPSGELDICFVEAVLECASIDALSRPIAEALAEQTKQAIARAKSTNLSSNRLVNFALAQQSANWNATDYDLAAMRYELAYLADPCEPKYLLALAELTAVGPHALTNKPSLAFQRAEAALQEVRHLAYHHEMDLLHVANFHAAERCLDEGDSLFVRADVSGAQAKAHRAIELFPRYARQFVLLWKCVDKGGDDSRYGDDLHRALVSQAALLNPPWIIDCRARQGILFAKQGQYEEGMQLLDSALRHQPNNQKWLLAKKEAEASRLGGEA